MTKHSKRRKPIVFVGNYLKTIKILLSDEYCELIVPKVIWVEFYVTPIFDLVRILRNNSHLIDQIFFLEPPTLNIFEKLMCSNEFFSMGQYGFSTLIVSIPKYCKLPHEAQIRIRELARIFTVFLIMDKLLLPRTHVRLVQMD
ncbi:MAG: hypothetical protein JSV04_14695 [Candidatus Heimdallarchaeota archaeon]|nr:MAG: hypothetical protein JSV04_14695 [Candidatus Heimdallarchaeota archaeon]